MRRREFITLLGGAAMTWPLAARAQQPAMPVIGYLHSTSAEPFRVRPFLQGLNETGYGEGRNVLIEYRWGEEQYDRLPALAADLVRRQVTVIFAASAPSALAARIATATIPIVFRIASDPVEFGLVASLNRPGGNLTGVTTLNVLVGQKELEVMHELAPPAAGLALLVNPTRSNVETELNDLQAAARTLGRQVLVLQVRSEHDLDTAFATLAQQQAGGVVIGADGLFLTRREQLAALALRHRVPAISPYREFAAAGGLMSYGGDFADSFRQGGIYTGRVLRGDKPADLPVQQATKVTLTINLKTAKALGLEVPAKLLALTDEVIE